MHVEARMVRLANLFAKRHEIVVPAFIPSEVRPTGVELQLKFVFKAVYDGVNKILELGKEPGVDACAEHERPAVAFVRFAVSLRHCVGFGF